MALATSIQFVHLSVPRDISEMVRDINVASWTALGQMVMILSNAMVGIHISYKFVEGEIFYRASKVIGACIFFSVTTTFNWFLIKTRAIFSTNLMEK